MYQELHLQLFHTFLRDVIHYPRTQNFGKIFPYFHFVFYEITEKHKSWKNWEMKRACHVCEWASCKCWQIFRKNVRFLKILSWFWKRCYCQSVAKTIFIPDPFLRFGFFVQFSGINGCLYRVNSGVLQL